jgi:hypothetical protein
MPRLIIVVVRIIRLPVGDFELLAWILSDIFGAARSRA